MVTTSVAPEDDALAQWEAISRRVQSTQQRLVAPIEDSGIPSQWFAVLHLLLYADQRRMPMTHLADDLSMTSGGFTKLADRMGQEGLIDRRNSAGDRRVIYAGLTTEGLRLARQTDRMYRAAVQAHVIDILTSEKLALLAAESEPLDREPPVEPTDPDDGPRPRDPSLPDRRTR
jgi:DNA-binding MarR family transcriptional regulator